MKEIYQRSVRTIVWLGGDHEIGDDQLTFNPSIWGFETIERGSMNTTAAAFKLAYDIGVIGSESRHRSGCDSLAQSPAWGHLRRVYKRPWFERLWVIQELVVAKEVIVVCGGQSISWDYLQLAASIIVQSNQFPKFQLASKNHKFLPLMGAERLINVASPKNNMNNLLVTLHRTQYAKYTDPRDRLYAIFGISNDEKDVNVDYLLSVEQVYTNWAMKRISRLNNLDVLSACENSGKAGLPSWVPDLRQPWGNDRFLFNNTHHVLTAIESPPYRAGNNGKCVAQWIPSADRLNLVVPGQRLDRVIELGIIGDPTTEIMEDPTNLTGALWSIIKSWEDMFTKRQSLVDVGIWTIIRDMRGLIFPLFRDHIKWRHEEDYGSTSRLLNDFGHWRNVRQGNSIEDSDDFQALERVLFTLVYRCQPFITAMGKVGIIAGNCLAELGDYVFALDGGATPFILREVGDSFRLMGPCYLEGHMQMTNRYHHEIPYESVSIL